MFKLWQYTTADKICFMYSAAIFSEKFDIDLILSNNSPPEQYLVQINETQFKE